MMTVYDLKVGQKGIIHNIDGDERLAKRLLALGCINNTQIEIKKIAPLGKSDAKNIFLKDNEVV